MGRQDNLRKKYVTKFKIQERRKLNKQQNKITGSCHTSKSMCICVCALFLQLVIVANQRTYLFISINTWSIEEFSESESTLHCSERKCSCFRSRVLEALVMTKCKG